MKHTSSSLTQVPSTLSPWFVALIAMMTLVAVALAVALVVTSGAGPHLAQAAQFAQSFASNLFAYGGNPHPQCPGGLPIC